MTTTVSIPGPHGHPLTGDLSLPATSAPRAWALMAHCFACGEGRSAVDRIARTLTAHGLAVLRIDFAETEDATAATPPDEDLLAAAEWLAAHHGPAELLIGHSLGGAAVLRTAPRIPTSRALVTIGTRADGLDPDALGRLRRALMVMHSPVDNTVGIDNARQIYVAARHPKSFVTLDDADHLLTEPRDAAHAGRMIAAWVQRYLDDDESAVVEAGGSGPDVPEGEVHAATPSGTFRTEVKAGRHRMLADEPASVGGTDEGPTPYGYLLAGLGACTSMTLQMYARRKKWPLEEARVELTHAKVHAEDTEDAGERTGRIDRIERRVALSGPLDDAQKARLLEIADKCPVHRTLHNDPLVVTALVD